FPSTKPVILTTSERQGPLPISKGSPCQSFTSFNAARMRRLDSGGRLLSQPAKTDSRREREAATLKLRSRTCFLAQPPAILYIVLGIWTMPPSLKDRGVCQPAERRGRILLMDQPI